MEDKKYHSNSPSILMRLEKTQRKSRRLISFKYSQVGSTALFRFRISRTNGGLKLRETF